MWNQPNISMDTSSKLLDWRTVSAILFVALMLRVIFFNGSVASDDFGYFRTAQLLWQDFELGQPHHRSARLPLLTLVAGPAILANNILIAESLNVLLSVGIVLSVMLFCDRFIGSVAAIAAGAFVAVDGPSIVYAAVLLPETLLTLLMFGSTLLLFLVEKRTDLRQQCLLCFASGAMIALAYSTKEPGILLSVPAGIYLTFYAPVRGLLGRATLLISLAAGFVGTTLLDFGLLYWLTGDFLFKLHGMQTQHNAGITAVVRPDLLVEFRAKTFSVVTTPAVICPIVAGTIGWVVILARRSALAPFALSGAFVLLYLLFGSTSLSQYVALPYQDRYLSPIVPYAAVGIGAAIQWAHESSKWKKTALPTLFVAIALSLIVSFNYSVERSGRIFFTEALTNAKIAVGMLPDDDLPIYASGRAVSALRMVLDDPRRSRLTPLPQDSSTNLGPGYYLVIWRDNEITWVERQSRDTYEELVDTLPLMAEVRLSNKWSLSRQAGDVTGARDWVTVYRVDK